MSVEVRPSRLGDVYTIRYRINGKQIRETLGLKDEGWNARKAKAIERQRLVEQKVAHSLSPTFDFVTLAWRWYNDTGHLKAWKPRTKRAYSRAIRRLDYFHDMTVTDIRPKHVNQFISQHGRRYAGKTVNFDISVLYAIFEYGIQHELLTHNPAAKAPRPKNGQKKWRILSPEEIQAVDREFTDEKARLMFRVLTRTGMRRGELRNLRVRDIDFEGCVVRVTDSKTEEGVRSIAIPRSLASQLKEWCERD